MHTCLLLAVLAAVRASATVLGLFSPLGVKHVQALRIHRKTHLHCTSSTNIEAGEPCNAFTSVHELHARCGHEMAAGLVAALQGRALQRAEGAAAEMDP